MCCSFVVCFFVLLFVYKLVDRLLRIPRIRNLSDRYIFVTGCDTGFGNLLAKRLDQLGCHVFAGCLTEKGEINLKKMSSDRLHPISLDVAKQESVRKALEYVKSKLPKGKGLWGVLNNAGVISCGGPADWMSIELFKEQCEVNLWGLIDVTLTFLPLVKAAKGRVVNTSSMAGRFSLPNAPAYCISKYGVEAFTDALRITLSAFGCKALLIEPGIHRTNLMEAQNIARSYRKTFEQAPAEVRAEYGEDFLERFFQRRPRLSILTGSQRFSDVVDAYEHALLGLFPRGRYVVGMDAVLYHVLQTLPEWLRDWVYNKMYANTPLPTCVDKSR